MEKSKKDDYDYSVQYFNKFKNVGYKFNDLIYHIWESEVLTELCAPVEKKKNYWKALAKMSEFVYFKYLNKGCILN